MLPPIQVKWGASACGNHRAAIRAVREGLTRRRYPRKQLQHHSGLPARLKVSIENSGSGPERSVPEIGPASIGAEFRRGCLGQLHGANGFGPKGVAIRDVGDYGAARRLSVCEHPKTEKRPTHRLFRGNGARDIHRFTISCDASQGERLPDGQISSSSDFPLSSPVLKKIPLPASGKSLLRVPPSCPQRGVAHVTKRGAGCGGRKRCSRRERSF